MTLRPGLVLSAWQDGERALVLLLLHRVSSSSWLVLDLLRGWSYEMRDDVLSLGDPERQSDDAER